MKFLYTSTAYPPSTGGAQTHIHQIAKLLNIKHSCEVVCFWNENRTDWLLGTTLNSSTASSNYEFEGISIHKIGLSQPEKKGIFPFVIGYYPFMQIAIPKIARLIQTHIHEFSKNNELIHNIRIGREPISYASLYEAHRLDVPFIFTPIHHPRWSGWLHRHFQELYRKADMLIALTHIEKETLTKFGVDHRKVFVTGNGPVLADTAYPEIFRNKIKLGESPIVLFLGQKYEYKGIRALVDAARLVWHCFPEAYFVFIGPRTKYSKKLFSEIADKRILEFDTVDLQTKTDALAACTLLCVPSSQESFGGVYTEAWSFCKPVIGCSIPAVSEVIDDGKNGLLTSQSPEMIADRIIQLLRDESLSDKLGKEGNKKVKERYSWDNIASLTLASYKKALSGNY